MSSLASTCTSTALDAQRTRQKLQEGPKPFNKRSTKSDHVEATTAKVKKLSHWDTAPRRVSLDTPAKALASALKRRHESLSLSTGPSVVVVPNKRSPGKVRFLRKEPMQDSPTSPRKQTQGDTGPSGGTVQVVVQTARFGKGTGERTSNSSKRKIEAVADDDDDDETDIVTTHIVQPAQKRVPNRDAEFKTRYLEIKSLAWTWVKESFSDITPKAKSSLDLLHLAHNSSELMEYANWISCCGQKRTWEGVFNEQRALLVYGILGKMLEMHVFTHEMFGADKEQLRELRELDMELVNRDGFYRQRCRAHKILAYLPTPTAHPPTFHRSLTALHASFLQLISPLLPSAFPPPANPPPLQHSGRQQLMTVLLKAATLSLAMRREREVAYHWEPHPAVGSLFDDESMHVLNGSERRDDDDWRRISDVEVVTMAGWPGCVAYRPRAADHDRKKQKQKGETKKDRGKKAELGIHRIGRAEVCVTFGSPIEPLSVEPENWLGKRLRVEMAERDNAAAERAKGARDAAAVAKKAAGLGLGVVVSAAAVLGFGYVIGGNPWGLGWVEKTGAIWVGLDLI